MPWEAILRVASFVLLELLLVGGLIAIPLGLSGNFIILAAALIVGLVSGFQIVSLVGLLLMLAFVLLGEVLEAVLSSLMAQRYGASKWGMLGAYAGGIAGAILGTPIAPLVGTIVGSFIGAAAGAVLGEWIRLRALRPSLPAGWGAILGKVASSFLKIGIGLGMVAYLQLRLIPAIF